MHIELLTLFPEFFTTALQAGLMGKAQEKGIYDRGEDYQAAFKGMVPSLEERYRMASTDELQNYYAQYMAIDACVVPVGPRTGRGGGPYPDPRGVPGPVGGEPSRPGRGGCEAPL